MAYKVNFDCTNNMAEYEALIMALKETISLKIKYLEIYGDSQLIINHANDIYNTKDEKLNPYKIVVIDLLYQFNRYNI